MKTIPHYWLIPDIKKEDYISEQFKRESAKVAIDKVCGRFDVTRTDLIGRSREARIAEARNILFYILHKVYKLTSTDTGRFFRRNHATVLSGANRIAGFIEFDKSYEEEISKLIN